MKVITEINKILKLDDDQIQLIKSHLVKNTLSKNDQFLRLDSRNDKIGFIDKGLLRSFSYDEEGNEITHDFFQQGSFFTDLNSYFNCTLSKVVIEALVDCDLYVFNRTSLDIIKKEIPEWASFVQIYRAQISMCLLNFQRKIIHSSSIDSFTLFSKSYNQAFNFAPKKHIASFLGVSPFTLSRIKI